MWPVCVSGGHMVGAAQLKGAVPLSPPTCPLSQQDTRSAPSAPSAPPAQGPSGAPFISHVTTGAVHWVRPNQNQQELCVPQTLGASLDPGGGASVSGVMGGGNRGSDTAQAPAEPRQAVWWQLGWGPDQGRYPRQETHPPCSFPPLLTPVPPLPHDGEPAEGNPGQWP